MKLRLVWLFRFAIVFSTAVTWTLPAFGDTRSDWIAFRRQFPHHAQVIALGPQAADGTRTIVISEPPPFVTFDRIVSAYRGRIGSSTTYRQRLGFDGWVKDIVAVVPRSDDGELQRLVEDLSRDLFGTSYKAYAVEIGDPPPTSGQYDLSVSSLALREWLGLQLAERSLMARGAHWLAWVVGAVALLVVRRTRKIAAVTVLSTAIVVGYVTREFTPTGPAGNLRPLHGGAGMALKTALQKASPGVYMTDAPGLVVLVARRDRPLEELAVPLREFALDGDLVLGAIGSSDAVAVIARERQIPVTALPPLRTETQLQLAAANTDELAQSYERMNLFAGSTGDAHRDWAPIFLSPELRDTEYGSLLNITDQLLKGWSEHGEIEYINFLYPKPPSFPFAAGLLETAKTGMVTYNWNTKGVGYSERAADYDVVAFARTGALPVDYLGEKDARMRAFEDKGYDYFAGTTGDPNLARVVQYAGMYQVWRHFKITAQPAASTRSHDGPEALLPMTTHALERLRDMSDARLASISESAARAGLNEDAERLKQIHEALQAISRESPDAFAPLARALVRPREIMQRTSPTDEQQAVLALAQAISHNQLVRYILSGGNALAAQLYASADSKDEPDSWIKTPSIVLSWATGKNAGRGEGGHNLSSIVTRTLIDDSLTPGSVRVAEEGGQRVLYYHSRDAGKIRSGVRSFARNAEQEPVELKRTVEAALSQAKNDSVTMSEALHLAARPATGISRGLQASAGVRSAPAMPWTRAGDIPSTHATALAALDEPMVLPMVVERTTNGRYLVSRGNELGVIEARDSAGVMDVISDAARRDSTGRTVHLHFKGIDDEQARPFAQISEFHGSGNGGRSFSVRTSVEGADGRSLKVLGEIRDGKWDVGRAQVRLVESPAPKVGAVEFEVVVPEKLSARSLRLGVEVKLREGVRATAEFIRQVQEVVLEVLRSMVAAEQDLDMLLASQRIKRALRLQDESIANLKLRIRTQAGEINVVRNVLAPVAAVGE